ncbi:hypothetical protein BN1723_012551 [Verticillium longisporum]|uniref:Uncharacterized protein n=1 Tax=Verticillium longisporum TaxID=100787 RepID=A0A0G4LJ65_VERLO|nr:hypothetical protein BN1723_012551 [Verticillium longisporum]
MSMHWLPTTMTPNRVPSAVPASSTPAERGLFSTPSRHDLPTANPPSSTHQERSLRTSISNPQGHRTITLRLPPSLPDFITTPAPGARAPNPATSSAAAPPFPFTTTAPPRYEEAVRPPGRSSYFLPNPPPGISAGPWDLRDAAHRRVLARLRLLPDDPSHADPARGITPAPPPGSLFRRGALAGEAVAEDEGERWETISAGEAENAEEEHLRWETLRERERGFVSWSRRCL